MFSSPVLEKGSIVSPIQYWKGFSRFPIPVLGKRSMCFQVHYYEIILDSPVHAVLGKGSVGSSVLYWAKDLFVPQSNTGKSFYRFTIQLLGKGSKLTSPILEKGSIGSPVQYCLKVVYVLKSNTGKRFWVPSLVLGKGSIGSPVQYWEKAL